MTEQGMTEEEIDAALAELIRRGDIEIIGTDEAGDPIYRSTRYSGRLVTDPAGGDTGEAVRESLTSDKTDGQVNVVDGLFAIARALDRLGNADAATPMGGMEALGKVHLEAAERIAGAIHELTEELRAVRNPDAD